MRFKNLAGAQVGPQSVFRVLFPEIQGPPVDPADPEGACVTPWLEVRPAAECNKAFFNALLKSNAQSAADILKATMRTDELERDRIESVVLYGPHVLTGNGGGWVDDETGALVDMPMSVEARSALLKQLPADLYDRVRRSAQNLGNFRR